MTTVTVNRRAISGARCAVLALTFLASVSAGCDTRRPVRYLIPHGYVGWVQVRYEVGGAPPLPLEDEYYVVRFPESGEFPTSSSHESGGAADEYYYYSGEERTPIYDTMWGGGGMVWGGSVGSDNTHRFFVGSENAYRRLVRVQRPVGRIDSVEVAEAEGPVLPDAYLIPEGYVGWIKVLHNVPGAPPAPVEDGHHVIEIPPDGKAATCSSGDYDWARNAYYYVAVGTRRSLPSLLRTMGSIEGNMIWGEGGDGDPGSFKFFVGTREQYKAADPVWSARIGPLRPEAEVRP